MIRLSISGRQRLAGCSLVRHTRGNVIMRLDTSCVTAVILIVTNRLIARLHRNGSRIYGLSLLLQRGVDQRDQSKQANQSCDYESEDRRPYRYVNSQKQGRKSNHSGFKDTTNDGESSCFAKVAVPVRCEVCHRDSNSEKCDVAS